MNYKKDGAEIAHSLEEALKMSRFDLDKNEEIFIIGGAEIYNQALPLAQKLYITKIDAEDKEADTFFPKIDSSWKEISREEHEPDDVNLYKYAFLVYEKF